MTKTQAEKTLRAGAKLRKKPTGPTIESFTEKEYIAVRVLTAERKSQAQIADLSGLSLSTIKRVVQKDEGLHTAFILGRDDRVEKLWQAAAKHAFDADSTKQIRALELLAKLEGMLNNRGNGTQQTNVLVNVNQHTAPSAVDGRTHAALMRRLQKGKAPVTIEHKASSAPPISLDPIAAVKARQKRRN